MNEECEELPCPETNTFQVDDLVRVYSEHRIWDDKIIRVNTDGLLWVQDSEVDFDMSIVHFKQCRPLKKKEKPKPREFFIYRISHGVLEVETDSKVESAVRTQDRCHACGEDFNK